MKERRCNREAERIGKNVAFASEEYSLEELIAQLSSGYLMNILGVATPKTEMQDSAYIQSWIQVLQNDVRMIVKASTRAQKSCDFILGTE